jgi:hypothetical protein
MAKTCNKCKNKFPAKIEIDGRIRNLNNRKYCLSCSPFGQHNTSQLEKAKRDKEKSKRSCHTCQKIFISNRQIRCASCIYKTRIECRIKKVYDMVGTYCWFCGYDRGLKGSSVLEFHHVIPEEKKHGLDSRTLAMYSWDKIEKELQKCCSLCCRCHRELHAGLIDKKYINSIYVKRWKEIKAV